MVTLVCEAHGVPPPTLTWMKDSEPLSFRQNTLLHDGGETHFQLLDVRLEDAGLYTCTAKNQAGTSTKTFNLTVLGRSDNVRKISSWLIKLYITTVSTPTHALSLQLHSHNSSSHHYTSTFHNHSLSRCYETMRTSVEVYYIFGSLVHQSAVHLTTSQNLLLYHSWCSICVLQKLLNKCKHV